ncbi:MAG: DbpA RNA binding domain-containing protein [Gemmatimonadales bacterium]
MHQLTIEERVSDFESWGLAPVVAAGMERLGWNGDSALVRDVVPPVVRGTNLVAVLPPAPAWAGPIAAGILGGLLSRADGGRVLILTAPALVPEWGTLLASLAEGSALRIEAASGAARAARRLKADAVDVLVASPDTALTLHTRSALGVDRIAAIVFAWPEDWDADEAIAVLLQDLPKDAQRVVLTARAERLEGSDGLVERYARRALVVGAPAADANPTPAGPVRTVPSSWSNRPATIAALLEATDPHRLTIWTADTRDHALLRGALGGLGEGISLLSQAIPDGGTIVCYDPPSLDALRALTAAGDVVLLVPPGTEGHIARVAAPRRPMVLESAATALMRRDAGVRGQILAALEHGPDAAALYALAPLFERFEPQVVAAAVFGLWRGAEARRDASPVVQAMPVQSATPVGGLAVAKLWVGAGKKDDATVGDLVAVLVKEVGIDRSLIGRVELRDTFTLVEVPAADADRIAEKLTGLTIRRRRLTARVDRGPTERPSGGMRGGSSGGSGGRPPFRPRS